MVNNQDIRNYRIRKGLVDLTYSPQFELMQVQSSSGLTPEEFDALPGNPQWCHTTLSKAHYIAWYRGTHRIEAVGKEAQSRKYEAEAAKNRMRGGR